jgi:fructokinase
MNDRLRSHEIMALVGEGNARARQALADYTSRLARAIAHVVNIIDPDVVVLGGGMSNVESLYTDIPPLLKQYVFGGECGTPVLKNQHGDSSGVRGAAWLWPQA